MSDSDPDPDLPTPETSTLALEGKPSAKIAYTYYNASRSPSSSNPNPFSTTLLVFLNGLILPRSSWDISIESFLQKRLKAKLPYPALLSYDRYGQGDSDHDPTDKEPPPSHGHDCLTVARDLRQFLLQIWKEHLDISNPSHFPQLIFVGNSIGCAIARLFAAKYPGTVAGLLFLDSVMANSDFISIFPDPDAPSFNEHSLPADMTAKDVRNIREAYRKMFHPDVPNNEGLSRRNLAKLLPRADSPKLEAVMGQGPFLTVVGHDWEEFAEQSEKGPLKSPKILTMAYMNPVWQAYNQDLVNITDADRAIGPIIAVKCGHFIQKDNPEFVAEEVGALLDRITNRNEQLKEKIRG